MSGTLGYLLQQTAATKPTKGAKKDSSADISAVSNLFSKEAPVLAEPVIIEDEEGKVEAVIEKMHSHFDFILK